MASRQRQKREPETVAAAASLDRLYSLLAERGLVSAQAIPPGYQSAREVAARCGLSPHTAGNQLRRMWRQGILTRVRGRRDAEENFEWFYGTKEES